MHPLVYFEREVRPLGYFFDLQSTRVKLESSRAEQGDTHKWPVRATVTCSSRGRMRNSQIFVGRHPSCELTIHHRAVSTFHCTWKSSITLITAGAQAACLRRGRRGRVLTFNCVYDETDNSSLAGEFGELYASRWTRAFTTRISLRDQSSSKCVQLLRCRSLADMQKCRLQRTCWVLIQQEGALVYWYGVLALVKGNRSIQFP